VENHPTKSPERTNTVPKPLDLTTLNASSEVVRSALRNQVCDYEQKAIDAAKNGDYLSAQTYKNWAFAADLCVHIASGAISALFCEALNAPRLRLIERTEFASLNHSEKDRHLDDVQTEVASAQPDPEPA
jgi:hypothetical protein